MAVSIAELTNTTVVHDTDAKATAVRNVKNGAATLYGFFADNSNVSGVKAYLKLYDHADPTIGTTDPIAIFEIEGGNDGDKVNGGETSVVLNGSTGIPFATALSYVVEATAGTSGTANPGQTVVLDLITN